MSLPPRPNEPGCHRLAERLVPLLDDALEEGELAAVAEHLERCPRCARRVEVERAFDRALRARLRRSQPPAELFSRVRAALAREAPTVRESPWRWARATGFAAAAASLVLVLLVLPLVGSGPGRRLGSAGPVWLVREAVVVDTVCDGAGLSLEQQRACRDEAHLNGLRCPDGRTWAVVLTDGRLRALVLDPELRGRRLVVEGEFHPASGSVRVERWSEVEAPVGPGEEAARTRRGALARLHATARPLPRGVAWRPDERPRS